jgi:RNA polymerase sigma factor (sigma-70 family)
VSSSALDALTPEVVDRATSGDGAALDAILSGLSRPFYNLALRMLHNHEDAEDAAQECLVRVATKLSTFRGESRFSTWAWRVATRSVLDFRAGRAQKAALTSEAFSLDLADGLDVTATVESPEDRIYAAQVKLGCGRAMLQVLDGDHRLAYTLTEILGLDQSEAADALGISHAAFRKRLSRARSRIREVLSSNCGIVDKGTPAAAKGVVSVRLR